jgi:beta-lactamase class D
LGLAAWLAWGPRAAASERPAAVLETSVGGKTLLVEGDGDLAGRPRSPGSAFKIIIAWAALGEALVGLDTRHHCDDAPPPGGPREIDLREAMRYSSNEYFLWLAGRLGVARLTEFVNRSGFAPARVEAGWVGPDPAAVVRGGGVEVTAWRLHALTLRVMSGGLASNPAVQAALEAAMAWPSADPAARVFGKTGTWGGASWFTGFVERDGARKAITVLVPYVVPEWRPARDRAIRLFYGRAGVAAPAP